MKDSLNIAVAGATGYVGLELIKILSKHPRAKILYLCANKSVGKKINSFDKKIINKNLPIISKINNPISDVSSMDGYAICSKNLLKKYKVVGESSAGKPYNKKVNKIYQN